MSTANSIPCVDQIGETAGRVWHCLHESGPMSLSKLVKNVEAPRDVVLQAVGWLAREQDRHRRRNRTRVICLK